MIDGRDDDPISISSLQHHAYCPRQCGLIILEATFDENIYTLRGTRAHERVDETDHRFRGDIEVQHGVPLWSDRLGLVGRADAIEQPREGPPYPVEHKVSSRKSTTADDIQLCAQAICIEEMLGVDVPKGAIFSHATKRRREVTFTPEVRRQVETTVSEIREIKRSGRLPPPVADARCEKCSLLDSCLPFALKSLRAGENNVP